VVVDVAFVIIKGDI